jgi:hypothetical protein
MILAGEVIQIDPIVDARVTRKFDERVVPLLFGLWLLAFIDRSNISNARIHQLIRRIGLFYCAAPLSGAIGGLLATGISQITIKGYNG